MQMQWCLIKKVPNSALEGDYKNPAVRQHLREEAGECCVYCAIHENRVGGVQAFHVDHYRPKSRAEFQHLIHSLSNLFYSCPICNRFKGSKWKGEPAEDHSVVAIPDPSIIDYGTLFDVDFDTGIITGKYVDSRYVVHELFLDRPQLRLERRRAYLDSRLDTIRQDLVAAIPELKKRGAIDLIGRLAEALAKQLDIAKEESEIPYYELQDITR